MNFTVQARVKLWYLIIYIDSYNGNKVVIKRPLMRNINSAKTILSSEELKDFYGWVIAGEFNDLIKIINSLKSEKLLLCGGGNLPKTKNRVKDILDVFDKKEGVAIEYRQIPNENKQSKIADKGTEKKETVESAKKRMAEIPSKTRLPSMINTEGVHLWHRVIDEFKSDINMGNSNVEKWNIAILKYKQLALKEGLAFPFYPDRSDNSSLKKSKNLLTNRINFLNNRFHKIVEKIYKKFRSTSRGRDENNIGKKKAMFFKSTRYSTKSKKFVMSYGIIYKLKKITSRQFLKELEEIYLLEKFKIADKWASFVLDKPMGELKIHAITPKQVEFSIVFKISQEQARFLTGMEFKSNLREVTEALSKKFKSWIKSKKF